MAGEKLREKRRHIGRPDRPVLRPAPVEPGIQLVELPVDVDRVAADAARGQARGLAPPHPGVGHREHHHEVGVSPGQRRAALGEQEGFESGCPRLAGLLGALDPPLPLPPLAAPPRRRVQLQVPGNGVTQDRGERRARLASGAAGVAAGAVCFSQMAISSDVSDVRERSPNAGRMCTSIVYL